MPILIGSVMLYSVTDIAAIIDVHPSTVRKYLREKEVTGRKIAGKWYVAAGDLVGWLAEEGHDTALPAMPIEPSPLADLGPGFAVDFADAFEPDEPEPPAPTEPDWRTELAELRAEAKRLAERAKTLEARYRG